MSKFQYFLRSSARFFTPKICPYCRSTNIDIIDRKFIVTTLNECRECKLFFRHPPDTIKFNNKFYQNEYKQKDGITTDLPSEAKLKSLLENNFLGSPKDYSYKIDVLKKLVPNKSLQIIDYGANWGYTSFQFLKAGFNVQAYEISRSRAKFGQKAGIKILNDENELKGNVDVFFNAHVIEHLPDIKSMFLLAKRLLNSEGFFVAYCPNGSIGFRKKHKKRFHKFWGQVHPNYLSADFFAKTFKDVPYLIGSNDSDIAEILKWDKNSQKVLKTSGDELFVFAKIKSQPFGD